MPETPKPKPGLTYRELTELEAYPPYPERPFAEAQIPEEAKAEK